MKKIISTIILGILILTTTSCSWVNKQTKKNAPSDKNMICSQIKQEMLFGSQDTANLKHMNTYTRQNQLLSQYKKFGCKTKNP